MRLVFKSVFLAVAALALSGVTAAAASAATHEWRVNGVTVEKSTPVTDTATAFAIKRQEGEKQAETITCALTGKGTVSAKGAGTITAWSLTSCKITEKGSSLFICEAGTLSGPTALNLPWKTQLLSHELKEEVFNEVSPEKGAFGFTWECKEALGKTIKVTCEAAKQENLVTNGVKQVEETWKWVPSPELRCEANVVGGEKRGVTGAAIVSSGTHLKAETGELSFR